MLIVNVQEIQKWTNDVQAIIISGNENSLIVAAPGPISATAGAYKFINAFGLEVDRFEVSKLNKNKWQINVHTKGVTEWKN